MRIIITHAKSTKYAQYHIHNVHNTKYISLMFYKEKIFLLLIQDKHLLCSYVHS